MIAYELLVLVIDYELKFVKIQFLVKSISL